ncbi:MAG: hypothetical protein LCI00_20185 [Chloroflexi bacterium]|nr:hypothetical protein [Chloroflexota bacterium]
MQEFDTLPDLTAAIGERHYVNAEFMYRPRPEGQRERIVFDYALRSRLAQLGKEDAVVYICRDQATIDSLQPFAAEYPHVMMATIITNPTPYKRAAGNTPEQLKWDAPESWQRLQTTDRWARIDAALHLGSLLGHGGYLLMPAHDAVWGKGLLARLEQFSQQHARNSLPAAVSPYTYYQHSAVPDANIPPDIIHLLNTAFSRDTLFPWKIKRDEVQAFWGKMSMTPFGLCGVIRREAEQTLWEDDLDIDRIIRDAGYGVRCLWVNNPQLYRQALPVFDRDGVRKVIERTLHYSLHIPDERIGGSSLNTPLDWLGCVRQVVMPRFRRYNPQSETLIETCANEIAERLQQYGASWVDWGRYRHVVRVGDPVVEVWQQQNL